jgi:pantoate--beta-alanine ligase
MRIERKAGGVRAFVQAARRAQRTVGLVPTMGALHEGHLALIQRSVLDNEVTVASIFVNPAQFGPAEDFNAYPRDLERDAALAHQAGVGLIFAPEPEDMYAPDHSTWVQVEDLTSDLCGKMRPGHFRGVATVVAKLFNLVLPDRAYFGEKDYQQLQVIRRLVRDLNFPLQVVGVPTMREADGLALSSRNAYLSPAERQAAPRIYEALQQGAQRVREGGTGAEGAAAARAMIEQEPLLRIQYLQAVDPDTLADRSLQGLPLVLVAAVYAGRTRLIDNLRVED